MKTVIIRAADGTETIKQYPDSFTGTKHTDEVVLTQAEYDALGTPDPNTIYFIKAA